MRFSGALWYRCKGNVSLIKISMATLIYPGQWSRIYYVVFLYDVVLVLDPWIS